MLVNIESKLGNLTSFLDTIFSELAKLKLDVSEYYLDHICYRTQSETEYKEIKLFLADFAKLLVESDVNGRLISTFKFFTPLKYKDRELFVIEIPSPKKGVTYNSGFEHVEFVLKEPLANFLTKYSNLNFDLSNLYKEINPEARIKLDDIVAVKFHEQTLEAIIEQELSNTK